jgi:hypothetical protein
MYMQKTFQHTSSYCINLLENDAHIWNIVLFAVATLVYHMPFGFKRDLINTDIVGIWNDLDWWYCISRYVLHVYNYTEFIFARVLNYFRLDEEWEHITNIEKDFLSSYDYHYK